MKHQLQHLMDRYSYYIYQNRNIFSFIISGFILGSLLLILHLFIPENIEISKLNSVSLSISYRESKPVLAKNSKPEYKEETKQIETKKIQPKTEIEKKIIEEPIKVEELEHITEKAVESNEDLPDNSFTTETIESPVKPKSEGSSIVDFKDISTGLNLPEPTYPAVAKKWKKQGVVELEIIINRDGSIKDVVLLSSSGHSVLDNHCIKTVQKSWKFNPASRELTTKRRFIFKLL